MSMSEVLDSDGTPGNHDGALDISRSLSSRSPLFQGARVRSPDTSVQDGREEVLPVPGWPHRRRVLLRPKDRYVRYGQYEAHKVNLGGNIDRPSQNCCGGRPPSRPSSPPLVCFSAPRASVQLLRYLCGLCRAYTLTRATGTQ